MKLTSAERVFIANARKRAIAEHDTNLACALGVVIAIDNEYTVGEIADRITSLVDSVHFTHEMKTMQVTA